MPVSLIKRKQIKLSIDIPSTFFVSRNANNLTVQEYILPGFPSNRRERVKKTDDIVSDTDQVLIMNNERSTIPETIFQPDDIGMRPIILMCLY